MLVGGGVVVVVEGGGRVYTRDFGKSSLVGIEGGVVAISFFLFLLFLFVLFLSWRVGGRGGDIGGKSDNGGVVVEGGSAVGRGLGTCYGLAEVGLGSESGKMFHFLVIKI